MSEERDRTEQPQAEHASAQPLRLGVYVHVPFCAHVCTYCDFVKEPLRPALAGRYVALLPQEARLTARRHDLEPSSARHDERRVDSLYLGGGTPSVLSAAQLAELIAGVRAAIPLSPAAEVTIEANPESLDDERLAALAAAGVNRLSLGVQAEQPHLLRRLGRRHRPDDVRRVVAAARRHGISNVNLDLMYGLPGQTMSDWRESLAAAMALQPEHLSLYSLQVEVGTAFARLAARGRLELPDEDEQAAMYELACDELAVGGWRHYEISNWARPGRESRHHLLYWENQEWLGLGPGAASRFAGRHWTNTPLLAEWAAAAAAGAEPPRSEDVLLDQRTLASDTVILGLRLLDGVSLRDFARRFERPLQEWFPGAVESVIEDGLAVVEGDRLHLSSRGLLLGNRAFAAFV